MTAHITSVPLYSFYGCCLGQHSSAAFSDLLNKSTLVINCRFGDGENQFLFFFFFLRTNFILSMWQNKRGYYWSGWLSKHVGNNPSPTVPLLAHLHQGEQKSSATEKKQGVCEHTDPLEPLREIRFSRLIYELEEPHRAPGRGGTSMFDSNLLLVCTDEFEGK